MTWLKERLKIENLLPLAIAAVGLIISYDHIRRRTLLVPELAPVAVFIPLLFDLVVVYTGHTIARRMNADLRGWSWPIIWPTLGGLAVLGASLAINLDYVKPKSTIELILGSSAVLGGAFIWELWRSERARVMKAEARQAKEHATQLKQAAERAVEAFRRAELPQLLQEAQKRGYELGKGGMGALQPEVEASTNHDELKQRRQKVIAPTNGHATNGDAIEQTRRLLDAFEAQGGDRNDQTGAIKFIRQEAGITYGPAHRRYKQVMEAA